VTSFSSPSLERDMNMQRGSEEGEESGVGGGAVAIGPVRLTFKGPQGLVRSQAAHRAQLVS
jgi:hypothetical protein